MRFKLYENLSRGVYELFREAGHDTVTVREEGLQTAPDDRVCEAAAREARILVTLDRDFGQVLRFPPEASARIIVIDLGPRASHRGLLDWIARASC